MAEAKTKKLFNKGSRTIWYGKHKEALFKPKTTVSFPVDQAEYLQKLYPNELSDSEDVQEAFQDAKAVSSVADAEVETSGEAEETNEKSEDNISDENADSGEKPTGKRGRPARVA